MAKNRKIFGETMHAGAMAAEEKNWSQAIAAYQQALTEFPNDVNALSSLGSAYFNAGQLETALGPYQRASERTPDDPALYERIGQIQEKLGNGRKAAKAYLASAERYLKQPQSAHLALERWHDAVCAYPDSLQAHVKLLQHYQRQGQVREAVEECMTLTRIYNAQGQNDYAIQVCEHALKLTPRDAEVLATLDKLRHGEPLGAEPKVQAPQAEPDDLFAAIEGPIDTSVLDFEATPDTESVEDRGSPIEITRQKALSDLAEILFEEEVVVPSGVTPLFSKAEIDALIGQAIDFQTRGKVAEAIGAYEKVAEAGTEKAAVHFNLGLLYQEKLRFDQAITEFESAVAHPEYTLGSHFALGECYRAQGHIDEAMKHFIEVLKIVDLATVQREQANDLIQLYEKLADSYADKGESEQALEFTNALGKLLNEKGWEGKVIQARRQLDQMSQGGPTLSLAEMLVVPGSEHVLESVALSQEYARRSMFYAALEECYYALDYAPLYLPIHQQIAQVLVAMGKADEAVSKFVVIADAYQMRGNARPSMAIYQQALRLAPMDIAVRTRLIDLFISHGEIDQALENYLILADSYYHLAQMDQARETYQKSLELAPRGTPENRWEVRILHKVGDIDMQRVDWKRAIKAYERIRELAPDDERARLTLMSLYYRFNQPETATAELDDLLNIYHESGKTQRIFAILEDAVDERPDNISLRTRLAQVHLDAGNIEQALVHLDKLGDLQMESGRPEDARATIQAIIALNPPNVAEYQQLLSQLG